MIFFKQCVQLKKPGFEHISFFQIPDISHYLLKQFIVILKTYLNISTARGLPLLLEMSVEDLDSLGLFCWDIL